jgi:hypothetical protein
MDRLLACSDTGNAEHLKPFGAEFLTNLEGVDAVGGVACIKSVSTQVDDVSIKGEEDPLPLEPSGYSEDIRLII